MDTIVHRANLEQLAYIEHDLFGFCGGLWGLATMEGLHMDEIQHATDAGKHLVQLMQDRVLRNSNVEADDVLLMRRDPLKAYSVIAFLQSGKSWDSS